MRISDLTRMSWSIGRQLRQSSQRIESALTRLAGGVRPDVVQINQQASIRSITRAIQNLNEVNSFVNVRDQALGSLQDILQRMSELSLKAQSTLLSAADREQLTREMLNLSQEYDRQVQSADWNGLNFLDGSQDSLGLQLDSSSVELELEDMSLNSTLTRTVGSMRFTELTATANTGTTMRAIAMGDLDGDGDQDMVATDRSSIYVRAYFNNGEGQFTQVQTLSAGGVTNRPKIADLDGDGIQEIVFAQTTSGEVQIWKANGSGQYSLSRSFFAMSGLQEPEIFDANGDGQLDIAFTSNSGVSPGWGLALNNGSGSFSVSFTASLSSIANGISSADYDKDGDIDLFILQQNQINYFANDGSGNYSLSQSAAPVSTIQMARAGDVNADGNMDMVYVDFGGNLVSWLGDGSGNFSIVNSVGPAGTSLFSIGDLNGDGFLDMVVSDADDDVPYILTGNGNGSFTVSSTLSGFTEAFGSAIGDVDGDGVGDFVSTNEAQIRIFRGLGTEIGARSSLSLGSARDSEIAKESIDRALSSILAERAKLAAFQSRLSFTENDLSSRRLILEEQSSSQDTARDMMELVESQIRQQAQVAALSQAFVNAQNLLKLLPGF